MRKLIRDLLRNVRSEGSSTMIENGVHSWSDRSNGYIGISQYYVVGAEKIFIFGGIVSIVEVIIVILKKAIASKWSLLALKRFCYVLLASEPGRFENPLMSSS